MIRLLLIGLVISSSLQAGEIIEARVDSEDEHFLVHVEMRIHGEPVEVFRRLTDYANLHRLNHTITRSELLYHNPPHARVRVTTEGCIGLFCRRVVQVQDVIERRLTPERAYILVRVLPELSDIKYSRNLWHIRPDGPGYARVSFDSDMVPDFWVPPILGTILFENFLLHETQTMIEGLERLANSHDDDIQ